MPDQLRKSIFRLTPWVLFFAAGYLLGTYVKIPEKTKPAVAETKSEPSEETLENLAAIGYVDGVKSATSKKGVVIHDSPSIQPGLNFYTSGHEPEAFLMESKGRVIHKWKMRFDRAFPDAETVRKRAPGSRYWRKAHLFENGDLLVIYEGVGLIKVDKASKLIWRYDGNAHHDVDVQPDGTIYVLTRAARKIDPNSDRLVLEDFITILEPSGKEIRRISILKALQSSIYSSALAANRAGDVLHTNTVEVLDGSHASQMPFLEKGNILLSICFLDMIAVLDPRSEKIIWALTKLWSRQHTPEFLPDGDLILFDNRGARGKSRVLQIKPLTQQVVWSYEEKDFYSDILGASQRLQNGNTLITDSDDGRVFEITQDKRIVWEFLNPERAGKKNELVAVIPEMIRLSPQFPLDWTQ